MERYHRWQDVPADRHSARKYSTCLEALAIEAKDDGLYARKTYLLDIKWSLHRHMNAIRTQAEERRTRPMTRVREFQVIIEDDGSDVVPSSDDIIDQIRGALADQGVGNSNVDYGLTRITVTEVNKE